VHIAITLRAMLPAGRRGSRLPGEIGAFGFTRADTRRIVHLYARPGAAHPHLLLARHRQFLHSCQVSVSFALHHPPALSRTAPVHAGAAIRLRCSFTQEILV